MSTKDEILDYWFGGSDEPATLEAFRKRTKLWFFKDVTTDAHIGTHFGADIERAARGELDAWADSSRGRLALLVLLDQFPRNAYRGTVRAFAMDERALEWAVRGVDARLDAELTAPERLVFYLPLMHAEDVGAQERCLALFARLRDEAPPALRPELESAYAFAGRHLEIIQRFGRFPHRNAILGRVCSEAELAFLQEPNSSF